MKNILILGAGRSGTSLLAGLFAKSGYFMGENLYPGRETNPKGFFESSQINDVNEEIIRLNIPGRLKIFGREFLKHRPRKGQRWLAQVPVNRELTSSSEIENAIVELVHKSPYCYKDPRLSYTFPIWARHSADAVKLVVFRHPTNTVRSIIKECGQMRYLQDLIISEKDAYEVWNLMYSHILKNAEDQSDWVFIHYQQLLDGSGFSKIEDATHATIDRSFVDENLNRNQQYEQLPSLIDTTYVKLCEKAGYEIIS